MFVTKTNFANLLFAVGSLIKTVFNIASDVHCYKNKEFHTHPVEGSPHGVVDRAPQSPQGPGKHAELLFPPELHHLEKMEKV